MSRVWVVRADGGTETQHCVDGGFTGIGWCENQNASDLAGFEAIRTAYQEENPDITSNSVLGNRAGELARFAYDIQRGDIVITPCEDSRWLRFGDVLGDYEHVTPLEGDPCRYQHRRKVEWKPEVLDRTELSVPLQMTLRSSLTVFDVKHYNDFLWRIGRSAQLSTANKELSEKSVPLEAVLDVLLTLSPEDFELLVVNLLAAIGFEVKGTPKFRDGGIDFTGTLYVSSIAHMEIVGQVKRYKTHRKIRKGPILDLRGRIPIGARGLFVTTSDYAQEAREAANQPRFPEIGLVNGSQLVDLLIEYWRQIPEDFRSQLGLDLGLVPL